MTVEYSELLTRHQSCQQELAEARQTIVELRGEVARMAVDLKAAQKREAHTRVELQHCKLQADGFRLKLVAQEEQRA